MNLFFTVVLLSCQRSYDSPQGGPKCYLPQVPQRHMRVSNIKAYEPLVYLKCKINYVDPQSKSPFTQCEKTLKQGCTYIMNDDAYYPSANPCEKL